MLVSLAFWPSRLPGGDVVLFLDAARAADDAGIHSIHLGEHVVIGDRTDRYPFGPAPFDRSTPWPDPLITLAAAAGVTRHLRLSTGALLAPLRPAGILAKEVATLDALSKGRVELVLGVGWQPEEYEACGVPWSERYSRLDRNLAFCRRVWDHAFDDPALVALPKPVQAHIPILLGLAPTDRNLVRMAHHADGWCPMAQPIESLAAGIARVRSAFIAAGRSSHDLIVRAPVELAVDGAGRTNLRATIDGAERVRDAGATIVAIGLPSGLASAAELDDFIRSIGAENARRG